jgi:hypothetical protein
VGSCRSHAFPSTAGTLVIWSATQNALTRAKIVQHQTQWLRTLQQNAAVKGLAGHLDALTSMRDVGYVIGKVLRGNAVGGLLRYLYGPGRANEHVDAHLVASWDGAPEALEPVVGATTHSRLRTLTDVLEQPLATVGRAPAKPVWHCALRAAPGDRRLSDQEWAEVAAEVVHRTGLAPRGDDGACRWVAIRHADDHIHLVVTLAQQDGRRASTSNDFYRVGAACRWAEERFGLTVTAARDRTGIKLPTRAETEKARRTDRPEPSRTRLRREVRTAVAGAEHGEDFLSRLRSAGLLVRPRYSERNPGQITGYSVAVPDDRCADGRPVWFGGAKLARDLSWTCLSRRWDTASEASATQSDDASARLTGAARDRAWIRATHTAAQAAEAMRRLATTNPGAAGDLAHAAADTLAATAWTIEGRRGGPITTAAAAYERASGELWARSPARTARGDGIRAAARVLTLTGRARNDEASQCLALITQLIALTDSVATLRAAQGRAAQAAAARCAAEHLREIATRPTAGVVAEPRHVWRTPFTLTTGRTRG